MEITLSVKLDAFEGPLDLLLHLIEKNKVDIYDIPIAEITDQYLAYVAQMQETDLDIMSDFLVMAATLLRIKSQMLLPEEPEEEGEEEDPRTELVNRLLAYKMCKFMAEELKAREEDASLMLYRGPVLPDEVKEYEEPVDLTQLLGDLTLAKLHDVFTFVITKQAEKIDPVRSRFGKIRKEPVTMIECIHTLRRIGKEKGKFSFKTLLMEQPDKPHMIVNFLAILEMMKVGVVTVVQEEAFEDFSIEYHADVELNEDDYLNMED